MLLKIVAAAKEAGAIILKTHDAAVHQKEGHCNFVTDADVAVQNYLKKALADILPQARFFCEEQENEPLTDDYTFVIDPIDGTMNFMRGRQASAVSIGLLKNKTPVLAVIYNPFTDEVYTAEKGRGAYRNGEQMRVSKTPFHNAVVAVGTAPYDLNLAEKSMGYALQFLIHGGDLRRVGAASLDLADIACGRCDVFFELQLQPWDVAAGALLVTEAGGRFISLGHDQPYFEGPCGILACNALCEPSARQILSV